MQANLFKYKKGMVYIDTLEINRYAKNIAENYLSLTGKEDSGKFGLTIDDYLKIRTVAVQELSMGVQIEHNSNITPEHKIPSTHIVQASHTPSIIKKEQKHPSVYQINDSTAATSEQEISKEEEAIAILNAIAD